MTVLTNLPTDLLRSFIAVVELGGHSKAGMALGRSQPAISLQIRRLEELVRAPLLVYQGRAVILTPAGEALLSYAREMVRINDEAVSYFHRSHRTGVLRVGLPTDYAAAFLQATLTRFIREHGDVQLEVRCALSRELHEQLRADDLDVIVAVMSEPQMPYLSRHWSEQPIWAAAEKLSLPDSAPIPLGAHPEGCEYRTRMIHALDGIARRWRVVYSGPGIGGLQDAVINGLCVTALTRATLLPGMRTLREDEGFPRLDPLRIGLFYKHPRLSPAGLELVRVLVADLEAMAPAMGTGSA